MLQCGAWSHISSGMPLGHSNFFSTGHTSVYVNGMQAQPNISYGIVNTKQYHLYLSFDNHFLWKTLTY
jgi:hypothetical protein